MRFSSHCGVVKDTGRNLKFSRVHSKIYIADPVGINKSIKEKDRNQKNKTKKDKKKEYRKKDWKTEE